MRLLNQYLMFCCLYSLHIYLKLTVCLPASTYLIQIKLISSKDFTVCLIRKTHHKSLNYRKTRIRLSRIKLQPQQSFSVQDEGCWWAVVSGILALDFFRRTSGHLQRETQRPLSRAALHLPQPWPGGHRGSRGPDGGPGVHQPQSLGAVEGQQPLRPVAIQRAGSR